MAFEVLNESLEEDEYDNQERGQKFKKNDRDSVPTFKGDENSLHFQSSAKKNKVQRGSVQSSGRDYNESKE